MTAPLLTRLPDQGFVPPEADTPWAAGPRAAAAAADLAAFAADFFALAPAARRDRHRKLTKAATGTAVVQLAELAAGLDVVPAPQPDTLSGELSKLVQELFTLPPGARAARRLAWLTAPGRRDPGWVAAVRTVLRTDAPLARLDPRLFDWYTTGLVPRPVPAAPIRPGQDPAPSYQPSRQEVRQAAQAAATAGGGSGCGGSWLWVFVGIAVIRALMAVGGGSGRRSETPPPPTQPPAWQKFEKFPNPFTNSQVARFREYEREHKIRLEAGEPRVDPEPQGYTFWVLSGRSPGNGQP